MSIKKLRDRSKWHTYKSGGWFGIPVKYWEHCPICLHGHEITKMEYEKRKKNE